MSGEDNRNQTQTPKGARLAFGILMVLVYVGVGLLFICKFFNAIDYTVSCVIDALLIVYGIFRAYRLYRGGN